MLFRNHREFINIFIVWAEFRVFLMLNQVEHRGTSVLYLIKHFHFPPIFFMVLGFYETFAAYMHINMYA
jgi:hypothetical protein